MQTFELQSFFPLLLQIFAAFIGIYATSIMVEAPKRTLMPSGVIGALGWGAYLFLHSYFSEPLTVYLCSLGIAFAAQMMARILKTPMTTILIPGFYALVPGVTLYRALYFLISNDNEQFYYYISLAALTAGMIALGILTIDSCFNAMRRIKQVHAQSKKHTDECPLNHAKKLPDWKDKKEI